MNQQQDYELERFVQAQLSDYERAYNELRAGQKRSHWMWYIFPQLRGLGYSPTAHYYGLTSLDEANAYLSHPSLGPGLLKLTELLCELPTDDATQLFGAVDAMKLRSCLTLFDLLRPGDIFDQALTKYFGSQRDPRTLELARR